MEQKQNRMKSILMGTTFVVIILAMVFIYISVKPEAEKGAKKITIQVVIPDEETKEFVISTDALYLRKALDEEGLIEGDDSESGYFITAVNGRKADPSKEEWWCITKEGEDVFTGVDLTPITDGDQYELTLMAGY